jgi:hypothetical protein
VNHQRVLLEVRGYPDSTWRGDPGDPAEQGSGDPVRAGVGTPLLGQRGTEGAAAACAQVAGFRGRAASYRRRT